MQAFESNIAPDDARIRLADATRAIIDELASSTADAEAFARARDLVEQAVAVLGAGSHGRDYEAAEAAVADFGVFAFVDYSPLLGVLNPLAPPIHLSWSTEPGGTEVRGSVTYPDAYEGPPGCVHGGFIAAGFDEVLGFTQAHANRPGMTASLKIDYRSPTPLHRELHFHGRIERVEGRKTFTTAELVVAEDGRLCAQAEGLFIAIPQEVFDRMKDARAAG
ncbi:MAG: PaaI family thioesterase [Ilumatobacteraceae bacterium]